MILSNLQNDFDFKLYGSTCKSCIFGLFDQQICRIRKNVIHRNEVAIERVTHTNDVFIVHTVIIDTRKIGDVPKMLKITDYSSYLLFKQLLADDITAAFCAFDRGSQCNVDVMVIGLLAR